MCNVSNFIHWSTKPWAFYWILIKEIEQELPVWFKGNDAKTSRSQCRKEIRRNGNSDWIYCSLFTSGSPKSSQKMSGSNQERSSKYRNNESFDSVVHTKQLRLKFKISEQEQEKKIGCTKL